MAGKRWKRISIAVTLVGVALAALVVALPMLLSSEPGCRALVWWARARTARKIDVEQVSLTWKGRQQIRGVRVFAADGRELLRIPRVTLALGLLDLIRDRSRFGTVEILEPTLRVYAAPPSAQPASPSAPRGPRPAPQPTPAGPAVSPKEPVRIPSLHGEVKLTGGSLVLPDAPEPLRTVLKDLEFTLQMEGLEKPVRFEASLVGGDGRGRAAMKGTALLPPGGELDPAEMRLDAEMEVTDWNLAGFAAWTGKAGEAPSATGVLNLRGRVQGGLRESLQVEQDLRVASLELPGEGLTLGDVEATLRATVAPGRVELHEARVRSAFFEAEGSGTYGGQAGAFSGRARGDLDKASRLLSQLGAWPREAALGGMLEARVSGMSTGSVVVLEEAELTVSNLVFRSDGKTVREPCVRWAQRGVLDLAEEKASFVRCVLETSAGRLDLEKLEVATWGAGRPSFEVAGSLRLDLARGAQTAGEFLALPPGTELAGRLEARFAADVGQDAAGRAAVDVEARDLRARVPGRLDAAEPKAALHADVRIGPHARELTVAQWALTSSAVTVEARGIVRPYREEFQLQAQGALQTDLAQLKPWLDALGLLTNVAVGGQFKTDFSITLGAGEPGSFSFQSLLERFRARRAAGPEVSEERVSASVRGTLSSDLRAAQIERLEIASAPLRATAEASFRQEALRKSVSARGNLACDLDRLSRYIHLWVSSNLTLHGRTASPFELATAWEGPAFPHALRQAAASASLRVEAAEAWGLRVQDLAAPLTVTNGTARLDVTAQVNRGTLAFHPVADFREEKPAVRLPPRAPVLEDVELTPEIADQLMGRIHPLFRGTADARGRVGLTFDTFRWPMAGDPQREAAFSGQVRLNNVRLASAGLLTPLLGALKIREHEVAVLTTNLGFECREGRVTTTPVRLAAGRYTLTLSGSVGLDETLDFQAEVPLTEELVGAHAAPYLEGTTARVPIRGTISRPELNLASLERAVADLAAQAARKALEQKAGEILRGLFREKP